MQDTAEQAHDKIGEATKDAKEAAGALGEEGSKQAKVPFLFPQHYKRCILPFKDFVLTLIKRNCPKLHARSRLEVSSIP